MKRLTITVAMLLSMFIAATTISAQELGNLETYAENELGAAVEPVIKLFGSLAGAGLVNTADLHGIAGFEVGIRGNLSFVPDKYKNSGPLNGVDVVGLPLLQASVGLPANIEITGRIFNMAVSDDTDGNVTVIGGLVKYGLFQAPLLPKISIVVAYHALMTPDEYDFGTFSVFSLKGYVSHNFLFFTVYGGAGIDRASSKISLAQTANSSNSFEKTYSESSTNGTVGLTVSPFPFIKANADYSFGNFKSLSFGLSLSFR